MAQIKEFSSADLNTISRFGGVSNTLEKINGVTVVAAPAGTFLLDTYTGAAAAYSTRKLKTGVTVAARIRRSGDDIEADVEFDSNNEISLTSPISNASSGTYTDLADFVDHTGTARNAFIDEWKDQSGNANHAAQATFGSQPKLYDATTGLITENGKAALDFSNQTLQTSSSVVTGTSARSVFNVTNHSSISSARIGFALSSASTGANGSAFNITGECAVRVYGAVIWANDQLSDQTLGSWHFAAGGNAFDIDFYKNGSAATRTGGTDRTIDTASGNLVIGGWTSASFLGTHQEIIIWASDQSTNRTGIEENINSDYLIYQPTDAPTSGLLSTYTGAAAAYSVRQLSNKAVIALRVRRDSDDEERNIGWDSNGDLDTTAISDFCGTANGYVTRWWDQSTNANHADQATDGSQPQIYNGSAVITDNGKPALDTGSTGKMTLTQLNVVSAFYVARTATLNYASFILADATTGFSMPGSNATFGNILCADGTNSIRGTNYVNNTDQLLVSAIATSTGTIHVDGVSEATGTASSVSVDALFDGRSATNINFEGKAQEIVLWTTDQSSNRTGIESDINGYYSIYT